MRISLTTTALLLFFSAYFKEDVERLVPLDGFTLHYPDRPAFHRDVLPIVQLWGKKGWSLYIPVICGAGSEETGYRCCGAQQSLVMTPYPGPRSNDDPSRH
jgi:hypothetical protein